MKCISAPHIQMEAGVSNSTEPVFSAQHVERFVGGKESYLFVVMQVKQFSSSCLGICAACRDICNLQDGRCLQKNCAPVKLSPVEWLTALSGGKSPVTTHPPLCATRVTFIQRRSRWFPRQLSGLSSNATRYWNSGSCNATCLWVFCSCDSLMKGPSRRTCARLGPPMKHFRSHMQTHRHHPLFSYIWNTWSHLFPTVCCAACHPNRIKPGRFAFSSWTNTRQLMQAYTNTTLFSSSSFMHREIMSLLTERRAPHVSFTLGLLP